MATVLPIGSYLAVYRWSLEGDPEEMVTTCGMSITFPGSNQDRVTELYGQATAAGSITPSDGMIAPWTFVGVTLYTRDLDGELSVFEHVQPITFVGGIQATPPVNVACLVRKRTPFAGASRRGRFYLPPFALEEAQISPQGVHSTAQYNALAARVDGWYSNMVSNDCQPVIHHADGSPSTIVTSFQLDTRVATQRRRLR